MGNAHIQYYYFHLYTRANIYSSQQPRAGNRYRYNAAFLEISFADITGSKSYIDPLQEDRGNSILIYNILISVFGTVSSI